MDDGDEVVATFQRRDLSFEGGGIAAMLNGWLAATGSDIANPYEPGSHDYALFERSFEAGKRNPDFLDFEVTEPVDLVVSDRD